MTFFLQLHKIKINIYVHLCVNVTFSSRDQATFICSFRKEVQYFGLINQGATCYLNAVLQSLFMTQEFKDAVERYFYYDNRLYIYIYIYHSITPL